MKFIIESHYNKTVAVLIFIFRELCRQVKKRLELSLRNQLSSVTIKIDLSHPASVRTVTDSAELLSSDRGQPLSCIIYNYANFINSYMTFIS